MAALIYAARGSSAKCLNVDTSASSILERLDLHHDTNMADSSTEFRAVNRQPMKFTRIFFRDPRLALERPSLLAAAIGELLPFVLLITSLCTFLNDEAFPPHPRSYVLCAAQLVINEFAVDREQLTQALGALRPRRTIQ